MADVKFKATLINFFFRKSDPFHYNLLLKERAHDPRQVIRISETNAFKMVRDSSDREKGNCAFNNSCCVFKQK